MPKLTVHELRELTIVLAEAIAATTRDLEHIRMFAHKQRRIHEVKLQHLKSVRDKLLT